MKIQKKNRQSLYLQMRNNRWKWMASATATGMTASQAGAITISLVNNYISATGGNHLNADLTGDGHPDLTIANAFNATYGPPNNYTTFHARVNLNGVLAYARRHNDFIPSFGTERLGSRATGFSRTGNSSGPVVYGTYQLTGSIPLFFKDLHINGGAPTSGSLQVTVSTREGAEIQLDSFTYTSNTSSSRAVADQGSSLALLAMGAGGILALRRWRSAQGSNRQLPAQTS